VYEVSGMIIAYSIVHRGPLPAFSSEQLYAAISSRCTEALPDINDVSDETLRQQLRQVAGHI